MRDEHNQVNSESLRPERRSLGERGAARRRAGTKDKVAGKAQEIWGRLTHTHSDVLKGKMKQGKGVVEEALGNAEERLGIRDDT